MRTDAGLVSEVYNGDNREHGRAIARLIRVPLTMDIEAGYSDDPDAVGRLVADGNQLRALGSTAAPRAPGALALTCFTRRCSPSLLILSRAGTTRARRHPRLIA